MPRLTNTGDVLSDPTLSEYSFEDEYDPTSIFGNKEFLECDEPASSVAAAIAEPLQQKLRNTFFPFMFLPVELRSQVLEHLMIASSSISVVEVTQVDPKDLLSLDDMRLKASVGHFHYVKMQVVEQPLATSVTLGMLHLNSSLAQEAQGILYGRNKFMFRGFRGLARFLMQIGQNRSLLRNVEILANGEDLGGAMIQFATGLLLDAALRLEHFHLGFDLAWPFFDGAGDCLHGAKFLAEQKARTTQMAKYVLPCVGRIFRLRHLILKETAGEFLDNILSVHPVSFDPCGHLEIGPYLKWTEPSDFSIWAPCRGFDYFQRSAVALRDHMRPLLEIEGNLKSCR